MQSDLGLVLGILISGLFLIALFVACFVGRWHVKMSRKYKILRTWRAFAPVQATNIGETLSRVTWNKDVEVFPR